MALRLDAYRDRRQSVKGQKDAKDIYRIEILAAEGKDKFDWLLAEPYLSDEQMAPLDEI